MDLQTLSGCLASLLAFSPFGGHSVTGIQLEALTPDQVDRAVQNAGHPAALISADFIILEANARYRALFTGIGEEAVGKHCFTVSHGYSRPCESMGEVCPLTDAHKSGRTAEAVHTHFTQRGRELENVVLHPVSSRNGQPETFLELLYPVDERFAVDCPLIGSSPPFRRMMDLIDRVAGADIPVLLAGESGTGKELIAAEIHRRSARAHRSFVPVDCSGLPETLFESEMFGHERGAFTGATHPKKGLVEEASGGTLFLDEIGDVPLSQQVKLLRLIETGLYRRVGSVELRKSDFRLICATHRDLRRMVEEGQFRRDLYHRIDAFPIESPTLRDRVEDLPLLARDLLKRIEPRRPRQLSDSALRVLEPFSFPGNVRQLLNILQRACLLSDSREILPEHLPQELLGPAAGSSSPGRQGAFDDQEVVPLAEMERRYLQSVLKNFRGERRELAERLGISERSLYRKLAAL
jgi:two-component system, NtrC family, response regulator HydG